jgi:hypothetical protein
MSKRMLFLPVMLVLLSVPTWAQGGSSSKAENAAVVAGALKPADAQKLVPQTFFYAGQSAPVQARNSGGFRSANGKLVLAALVDSSGYSSAIAEKYQGFLVTDGKLLIGGKDLGPGAYGIGALPDGSFIVTDIGGDTLFSVPFSNDEALKRPIPLKFEQDGQGVRLYLGKKYVKIGFSENVR